MTLLTPIALQIGQHIGSYRLIRLLGEGGMGVVYEVVHRSIGRRAAMKFLTLDAGKHPELATRFINEARAANQIQHPGVVQIYEFGQLESGIPWMLMEFLQGTTLSERLRALRKEGQVFGRDGLLLLHQLCSVLTVTHEHNIVHRDLKPGNIMLVPDPAVSVGERVKLLDFGIAKLLDDSFLAAGGPEAALQTRTGAILGTPAYMAPEQCLSSVQIDGQADVYAVGVIAYQMFTGRLPYNDEHPLALMAKKIAEPPPPLGPLSDDIPGELADLLAVLLKPKPTDRPAMAQVESALSRMLGLASSRRSGFLGRVVAQPQPVSSAAKLASARASLADPADLAISLSADDTLNAPPGASPLQPNLPSPPPMPPRKAAAPLPIASAAPTVPRRVPTLALAPEAQTASKPSPVLSAQAPNPPGTLPPKPSLLGFWAALGLLAALSTTATLTILRHPHAASAPSGPNLHPDLGSKAPAQLSTTLAVPAAADLAAPETVAHVDEPAPARAACVPIAPTEACIRSSALAPQHYGLVVQSLLEANIRLCPGERIVLGVSQQHVRIQSNTHSLSHEAQDVLFPSLVGRLDRIMTQGDIEIRCKGH